MKLPARATVAAVKRLVRPADWTITPAARAGLRLEAAGCFDRTTTLDWPTPEPGSCQREG
jgi:Cu2+-containing amine oxidase